MTRSRSVKPKVLALPITITVALIPMAAHSAAARDWWSLTTTVLLMAVWAIVAVIVAAVIIVSRRSEDPAPDEDQAEDQADGGEFDGHAAAHAVAEGLANWRAALAPLDEAVLGYRRQLLSDGWSPDAAEEMALTLYGTQARVMEQAFLQAPAQE